MPTSRILAGEALTPADAVDVMFRKENGQALHVSVTGGPLHDAHGKFIGAVTISRDITERKRTEMALREQAQKLQVQANLIELAHDAIIVRDPANVVVSWNRGAERLYGWTAQEAMGKDIHALLQTHLPQALEAINSTLEQEGQWEGELTHRRRDGTSVIVESCWAMVRADGRRRRSGTECRHKSPGLSRRTGAYSRYWTAVRVGRHHLP